jgi:hypothetical protein
MTRRRPDGGTDVAIVLLGKKEVPRSVLRSILAQGRLTLDEFLAALR